MLHSRRPGFFRNVRTIHPEGGAAYHPFAVFIDLCLSFSTCVSTCGAPSCCVEVGREPCPVRQGTRPDRRDEVSVDARRKRAYMPRGHSPWAFRPFLWVARRSFGQGR
jgi:hypothetical protein